MSAQPTSTISDSRTLVASTAQIEGTIINNTLDKVDDHVPNDTEDLVGDFGDKELDNEMEKTTALLDEKQLVYYIAHQCMMQNIIFITRNSEINFESLVHHGPTTALISLTLRASWIHSLIITPLNMTVATSEVDNFNKNTVIKATENVYHNIDVEMVVESDCGLHSGPSAMCLTTQVSFIQLQVTFN